MRIERCSIFSLLCQRYASSKLSRYKSAAEHQPTPVPRLPRSSHSFLLPGCLISLAHLRRPSSRCFSRSESTTRPPASSDGPRGAASVKSPKACKSWAVGVWARRYGSFSTHEMYLHQSPSVKRSTSRRENAGVDRKFISLRAAFGVSAKFGSSKAVRGDFPRRHNGTVCCTTYGSCSARWNAHDGSPRRRYPTRAVAMSELEQVP